ncbi:DegT/DnrJ/EryC1/StrS aminotransferase family protein [Bradyrhizobium sp. WSM1253]|uniref:DegT/DnrJ/EryC1/StrS family aminotransferase n=1 Tax=Bradyrhizobium sp. WSM1253 TaxID=319003 RepID=UPI00025D2E14|nr:DegT/DnrJ/EryC1/StrS family aminotransferase [Bradyrhizobium sp. WSM1253]EIG63514.1 putative PLP-dependent enzyme possibly involved in cell wall biogenesis [Bradyrhizobium sp. WSM1253]
MFEPLYVAKALLPDLDDLQPYLQQIWKTGTVSNNGPLHQTLERSLEEYLGVPCAMLFNNGTVALLVALKLMNLAQQSEVITTPLTFAATPHAISWNGLKPVFADIDPTTLTLDPASVEKAISPKTSAILAVHVYGSVCDVDGLQRVADRHGLRLIYDAAHVFGSTVNGLPIGAFGDASVFSFHATKLFNTMEGGAITSRNQADRDAIYYLRNFGIKNEEEVVEIGINGKMNEVQCAIGLLNLKMVVAERSVRAHLRRSYNEMLKGLPGIRTPYAQPGVLNSEQYYHLIVDPTEFGRTRDDLYVELKLKNVFARKYFHPICTDFGPYKGWPVHTTRETPYVEEVKSRVLCLPFHNGVLPQHVEEMSAVFWRETGRHLHPGDSLAHLERG